MLLAGVRRTGAWSRSVLLVAAVVLGIGLIVAQGVLPTQSTPADDPVTALAERADRVVGIDSSAHAVQAARSRVPANATVHVMDTPNEWPSDRFDLVVLSEVGYFFSPGDWAALLARVEQSLTDDGEVLLCHWLPQPKGWPMNGEVVHGAALEQLCRGGRRVVAQYRDDSIRAEVVGPTPIEP